MMKNYSILTLCVLCLTFFMVSCNHPNGKNTNPIFNQYTPETKTYKDELVKQLHQTDTSQLTYSMEAYKEVNNLPYLYVHIQGDSLNAEMVLQIKDSKKGIEEILSNKGKGYSGAVLEHLRFDIQQDSTATTFVFKEISGIVD